ncbi:MAG: hypothetical protein O7B35_01135 [Deltaproteobacteria bacterium]|nr:hypothetical protein [Deltaproteobacteria bacterium]
MGNVTSTQEMLASSEDYPRFDLARLERSLTRMACHAVTPLDRRRLLRNARAVVEALEDKMPLSVVAARCESLVWAAARFIKKVEMRERAWNR